MIFQRLINSLVCRFCIDALGLVLFQIVMSPINKTKKYKINKNPPEKNVSGLDCPVMGSDVQWVRCEGDLRVNLPNMAKVWRS